MVIPHLTTHQAVRANNEHNNMVVRLMIDGLGQSHNLL